jgi:hypothetical protein
VLSNAHVMTTKVNQEGTFWFDLPNGGETKLRGYNKVAAYSENYQVDWAVAFVPGLTADSGVEPVKLSKAKPQGRRFQQTGAPRCVWPLTSFDCVLHDIIQSQRVYRWSPKSIGGQSGSSLRNNSTNYIELLLTWSWGNYGAGQPTSLIWLSTKKQSAEVGFLRVPGLVEVNDEPPTPEPGFFMEAANVQELPIWVGDDDDDGEDPPPTGKGVPVDLMMDHVRRQIAEQQRFLKRLEDLPADGELIIDPDNPPADDETDIPFWD